MKTKVKVIITSAAIVVGLIGCAAAVLINGAMTYVSRCAHIEPKENITESMKSDLILIESTIENITE